MTQLIHLVPRTTCPYCKTSFDSEEEQALHRSKCIEAGYQSNGNIPNNPDVGGKKRNKVNEYRRNNQEKQAGDGEEPGQPQGSEPRQGDPQ